MMSSIKTCVSLYSLQDEFLNKRMSLKDIMYYVKEKGAEGVEILPDQMLKMLRIFLRKRPMSGISF